MLNWSHTTLSKAAPIPLCNSYETSTLFNVFTSSGPMTINWENTNLSQIKLYQWEILTWEYSQFMVVGPVRNKVHQSQGPQYPPRYFGLALSSIFGYLQGTAVLLYWASRSNICMTTSVLMCDKSLCSYGSAVILNNHMFFSGGSNCASISGCDFTLGGGTQLPFPTDVKSTST